MGWFDPLLALAGVLVGVLVGLTGMGGGALMTPILVFFFGIDPLTAVSSDLVASLFMKPVGAAVHLRRGTVNLEARQVAVRRLGPRRLQRRLRAARCWATARTSRRW